MLNLFKALQSAEEQRHNGAKPTRVDFSFTEAEINGYMVYSLKAIPRPGMQSLATKLFPGNYVSTIVLFDFDAVERWKPGTIPLLLRPVLSGQKTIQVDYRFQANDGKFTFSIEKAYFQTVRLPALLVEEVIKIVAARQPEHFDTSKPMPIPFGVRDVSTGDHTISGHN